MTSSWKHVTQRMSLGLSTLLLVVLLAACGGTGSTGSGSTPTPKPPTPTPTTPAVAMQTYTGTNYSISYPQNWKVDSSSAQGISQTAIHDDVSGNAFTIVGTPDPGGVSSASSLADITIQTLEKSTVKNAQTVSVAPTVTINGVTWAQRSITGTTTVNGQDVPATIFLLVTLHPANAANTTAYQLIYGGPTVTFAQANVLAFQPMLQSFKFKA